MISVGINKHWWKLWTNLPHETWPELVIMFTKKNKKHGFSCKINQIMKSPLFALDLMIFSLIEAHNIRCLKNEFYKTKMDWLKMRITMARAVMSIVRVVINHKKWFKSLSIIHAISQSRSGSSSAHESKEYVSKHFLKYKTLGSRIAIFSDSGSSKLRLRSHQFARSKQRKPWSY